MAEGIKSVVYYVASIPNKVGEGARVVKAFAEAGVNFVVLLGYPKSARVAELIVVVDDKAPNLAPIGRKVGVAVGKKQKAFLLTGEDRPGIVASTLEKLAAANINVVSYHGVCFDGRYGSLLAVAQADVRKAAKALGA